MRYDIKVVKASFTTKKPHSLKEARELYVKVADEFIETFNTEPNIQSYLHNKPFNITNVSICFLFKNKDGTYTEGINHIVPKYETNLIRYYLTDPSTDRRIKVHEETYEEAKAILQKEHI